MRWGKNSVGVALGILLSGLLLAPASAAAPPGNDDFADRQVVSGALPLEVVGSNVEATKEEGEFIPGLAPSGHSVWFEWEATATDWVTIGACDNDFPTILAVFTGTALGSLTPAASGNADEGPDCPYSQRQYTFKAESGTKYVIAVDGNIFHLPEAPTPVTEGEIVLRIEETPPPPNDDFADATVLTGSITEEPGGARFYFATGRGFNWDATTEPGEPDSASSGASVWYTWTAPEEATYMFGTPCCGTGLSLDLYLGDAVDELTPFLVGAEFAKVHLAAGTTVRIRVSGEIDPETEEPRVANFDFHVSASLAPLQANPQPEGGGTSTTLQPDTTAPETFIARRKIWRGAGVAKFWFSSNEDGVEFRCKVDKRPRRFRACRSPHVLRQLGSGRHVLKVKAVDAVGNVDPTPAVARFRINRPPGALAG
jgi:hypothetical protein